jgi:hypothetical protein
MPDAELRESSNLRFKTGSIAPRVPLHGTRMGLGPPFRILIFGGDNSMSWIRAVALALPLVAASISTAEAADLPPGFYPGGAEPVILDRDAYKAFVARNQDKLQRIVQFITIIRANQTSSSALPVLHKRFLLGRVSLRTQNIGHKTHLWMTLT